MLRNAFAIAIALIALIVPTTSGSTYTERQDRSYYLTDQINQVRTPANLARKYLLAKIADERAMARAEEYERTGTAEFAHDLGPVIDAMDEAGWCWRSVGEVIGFSNQLPTSPIAHTADAIVDRWQASPIHWPILNSSSYNWGGGSWHISTRNGVYFFAYYVVNPC